MSDLVYSEDTHSMARGRKGLWGEWHSALESWGGMEQCLSHALMETPIIAIDTITQDCSNLGKKTSHSGQKQRPL